MKKDISPYPLDTSVYYANRGMWPSSWIGPFRQLETPFLVAYRLRFSLAEELSFSAYVSADERYILYADGNYIGRGSESGDQRNWSYEKYRFLFTPGRHTIVALVWAFGKLAPNAQISTMPGTFLFSPESAFSEKFGTGSAAWEVKTVRGIEFLPRPRLNGGAYLAIGPSFRIDGRKYSWSVESGHGPGWHQASISHKAWDGSIRCEPDRKHLLRPAELPPMLIAPEYIGITRFAKHLAAEDMEYPEPVDMTQNDQGLACAWDSLLKDRKPFEVPTCTRIRILVDLDNYYCAYPSLTLSGGRDSKVTISWAESLFNKPDSYDKGNRDAIDGKVFQGLADSFVADGKKRSYTTLWWRSGRYLEFEIETGPEPLVIDDFHIQETHYPLNIESYFESSRAELASISAISIRSFLMCAHETFIDCPYYEQLCYAGDSRYESLINYVLSSDSRLVRKTIRLFNSSRHVNGLVLARYPARTCQPIPTFALWWVGMVHDYALWRGDRSFIRSVLPGVRAVLDMFFYSLLDEQGLVKGFPGYWNMIDWVPAWMDQHNRGVPINGSTGINASINWQFVLELREAAALEDYAGDPELATLYRRKAARLAGQLSKIFWCQEKGLFAEDVDKTEFSEHCQCLALLSGTLPHEMECFVSDRLFNIEGLHRTSVSFSHYYFEVCRLFRRMDKFYERLDIWRKFLESGLRTCLERDYPARSDCHGWGGTPYYHFLTTVLGIRPSGMGFESVTIAPELFSLTEAKGSIPHPAGMIEVDFKKTSDVSIEGHIHLPDGLSGTFRSNGTEQVLASGLNIVEFKA